MKQGKEVKKSDPQIKDPTFEYFNRDEFFNNILSLPDAVKQKLRNEEKDWRFIDGIQFRTNGNIHESHWRPEKFDEPEFKNLVNSEGFIQRKEMILATRPKHVSAAYKKYLNDRNNRLKTQNADAAKELKRRARQAGIEDQIKVSEGYEENE